MSFFGLGSPAFLAFFLLPPPLPLLFQCYCYCCSGCRHHHHPATSLASLCYQLAFSNEQNLTRKDVSNVATPEGSTGECFPAEELSHTACIESCKWSVARVFATFTAHTQTKSDVCINPGTVLQASEGLCLHQPQIRGSASLLGCVKMAAGSLRIHQAPPSLECCFPRLSGVVLSRVLQLSL